MIRTPTAVPIPPEVLSGLNRTAVYGQVCRWLIHDLRNPSQALTLITEIMHEEYGSDEEPPENTIREATRHLVGSIELLDRVLRPPYTPADPGPISVRNVLQFLGALHRTHRSRVALDLTQALAQSLPAVTGVEDHLEHALLNVLMNAVESCAEREDGRIVVTARVIDQCVLLDFADNGSGVAEEMWGRLFEPFATTKADSPFAGLGLAVARDLLKQAGGSVEFEPAKAMGARFVVALRIWR